MAFGNGSGRDYPEGTEFYSFSIKTKDLPAPVFHTQRKGADGKWTRINNPDGTAKTSARVSGSLTGAAPKKGQHEGKDIHSVSLTIEDTTKEGVLQVYYVSIGETFIGRNVYNSLLALKLPADEIEIGLYQSKPKAGQTKTYASVALRQSNELVRGLYDPKGTEMPKTSKVMVNGKNQTDTYQLDLWFREKMTTWCKAVNTAPKVATRAPVVAGVGATDTDAPEAGAGEEDPNGAPPF